MHDVPVIRRGAPRPVELHLTAALTAALAETRGWTDARDRARHVLDALERTLDGIEAYRRHPYRHARAVRPVFWRCGTTRLLDYGGAGPPLVVIPSLINRARILDLPQTGSLLRWLAGRGLRVLLLDWGDPGREEMGFSLDDYALRRIVPALRAASAAGPVRSLGYCMGGTLMIGALSAHPGLVARGATLGAPWRFSATPFAAPLRARAATLSTTLETWRVLFGAVPAEVLQSLFAARDVTVTARKLQHLAKLDPQDGAAWSIVAVQDWMNDGVALPAGAARQCLGDWFVEDRPCTGQWRLGNATASAAATGVPLMAVIPAHDPICPPASTEALATGDARVTLLPARAGHIGMVASGARSAVWAPLASFLRG